MGAWAEQIACIDSACTFCIKSEDYSQKKLFRLTGEQMCFFVSS